MIDGFFQALVGILIAAIDPVSLAIYVFVACLWLVPDQHSEKSLNRYKIYLCKVFWSAPLSGTDSKAGTLIHEMSHFDVVAGTDDVVYGQTGAMNLASTDPNLAITNADSHQYFAENTPARP